MTKHVNWIKWKIQKTRKKIKLLIVTKPIVITVINVGSFSVHLFPPI